MSPTRRGLLMGALAGGGLIAAYTLLPRRYALPLEPAPGETAYNAWIKIARDGVISVAVPQCEMGQGVTTLLPQIVAVELGADWRQIAVEPAAISPAYANPVIAARWAGVRSGWFSSLGDDPDGTLARRFAEGHAVMITADGTALAAYEAPAREAAAAVRNVLAMAAAERWDVGWEECEAKDGFIVHGKRRLRFADLAVEAAEYDPPDPPVLRAEPARERPGAAAGSTPESQRLDAPSKIDGSFAFAGDVRLPNMVYAAIAHGPIGDSTLQGFDEQATRGITGLTGVVKTKRWLAAVASDWWAADRALTAMRPRWHVEAGAADSGRIAAALDAALRRGEAERLVEKGDPDTVIGRPATLVSRYEAAPALHATLETSTATARFADGKLELWLASQAPEQARQAVAKAMGLAAREVVLYPMPAGGSFDRRLEHEVAVEAASIARSVGRPVQLIYSRQQETLRGWPRAPVAAVLAAKLVPGGEIAAWRTRIAVPATNREFAARLFDRATPLEALAASAGASDALATEGAIPAYAIPHLAVDRVAVDLALPTSRLRGNAHGYTAFFTESFIDELAHKARREPLSYRIELLATDVRLAACLTAVARLGQWGGGIEQSGQGLACHRMDDIAAPGTGGGRIAVIATARRDERGVRVDKLAAVADIGRIVNLDLARQQIEGGLIFGLGLAMGAAGGYEAGVPMTARLAALGLPYLGDTPEIVVDFIDSEAPPFDPGELGTVAIAPAVANALFSATGVRFRRLPLLSEDV
ncbi:xanthine dehydrogenase family protein molybdopterin-binding subunit [Novosphingobium sp. Gsoil 351]|uniref:xanthine dehydrogenase family protein molybdopterin-binding subunit n=1 Tax=Novosphingobium sp. Gsoil 351 TaxID=2675225 RepID=UPI0012B4DE9A|nr:molybdopterin cofactor-binding domain-containing protein [Novosphingobium sp. Gsoil 351]QGN55236.1 molybdopterin-dependent oxidoreductase [Novosphingobium sp. Gsoil 351]